MSQVLDPSVTGQAKTALDRHEWREAFDLLSEADAKGGLPPEQLELLAQAAWWVGKLPVAIEARERAYAAHVKAGDPLAAAMTAVLLGHGNLLKSAHSVATGWMNRAERLLEGMEETPVHGFLAAVRSLKAGMTGDLDDALAQATRAHEIAVRFGDRDLEAMALSGRGVSLVSKGQVEEGLALLDEATAAAVGGELQPFTAGGVSCATIGACASMGDWVRALQWTEAQDRWCQREDIGGFPGMCRLHRAEIKRLRGSWLEAEAEARRATEELKGFVPAAVGLALYEIGEIRLRRGDLPAAEEALLRAHTYGRDPEPALALVRLAQGKVDVAAASLKRALEDRLGTSFWAPPNSPVYRLSLLPAQVEIALATGDLATARAAADELTSLAKSFSSLAVKAGSASATGALRLAEGDAAGATQALREGIRLWGELDAPYEGARVRLTLARAYSGQGDRERATLEVQTARAAFERLGATLALRQADELLSALDEPTGSRSPRATDRAVRTFVFTDIVDSTRLAELLGDEAWNDVIRWHDQAIRSLVAEHAGEEIKAIGDGFFLAFDDPDRAIECAIAIQRRLADQRRTNGFAPSVRIGVHTAEANRTGLDYGGTGVNQAARIGGAAAGGEIVVSGPTLAGARRSFGESGRRTVELKGISAPVEIVSIDWR